MATVQRQCDRLAGSPVGTTWSNSQGKTEYRRFHLIIILDICIGECWVGQALGSCQYFLRASQCKPIDCQSIFGLDSVIHEASSMRREKFNSRSVYGICGFMPYSGFLRNILEVFKANAFFLPLSDIYMRYEVPSAFDTRISTTSSVNLAGFVPGNTRLLVLHSHLSAWGVK
jgi:hypothetical protein